METWEIGDIVGFDIEGRPLQGLVEDVSADSYTVRVLALDTDGNPTIVTDEVHTVPMVAEAEEKEMPEMDELAKELDDIIEDEEIEEMDESEESEEESEEEEIEEEIETKAEGLNVGDFVRWNSAGGEAQGRIEAVHESDYTVPDTDFTITGTPDKPAYQIEVYDRREGGWVASGITVARHGNALTVTEPLEMGDTKRYPRYVGKVKNAVAEENENIGHIKGYLSVAENVDLGGDVVKRGAFKQTLNHKNGKTVFMLDHGYKTSEVIGVLNLSEDDMGLKMDGCINLATPQGKMAYETAKFQIEQGVPIGASIGYEIVKASPNKYGGYDLQEVKLYEGSMTPFPMNESALITEARKRHDRKYRKARALSLMSDAPKGNRAKSGDVITDDDIINALTK